MALITNIARYDYGLLLLKGCTQRLVQKLSGATCLKKLFHITERFFWENLSDVSVDATCVCHWRAHNVDGSIKEWFTFFFLANAQLLLGDITVDLCEHFLVRISVRISVTKY